MASLNHENQTPSRDEKSEREELIELLTEINTKIRQLGRIEDGNLNQFISQCQELVDQTHDMLQETRCINFDPNMGTDDCIKTLLDESLVIDWGHPDLSLISSPTWLHHSVLKALETYPYSKIIDPLNDLFNQFKETMGNEPFWISFPMDDRSGEGNWLIFLLWEKLRHLKIAGFLSYEPYFPLPAGSHILIIDDRAEKYLFDTIDTFTYNLKDKGYPHNFNYHLILPFTNEDDRESIDQSLTSLRMPCSYTYYHKSSSN